MQAEKKGKIVHIYKQMFLKLSFKLVKCQCNLASGDIISTCSGGN